MDVSVVLLTYNHERFVAQAIEHVLTQRTRGEFELLISEDCSTDGTRQVVAAFAARYPHRIRVFLSDCNLNSNEVTLRCLREARGRYIAFLDGDDYWTSDEKLQRQVDFLDGHARCSMCFHNVTVVSERDIPPLRNYNSPAQAATSGLAEVLRENFIAGCSPLIRRSALEAIPAWYEGDPFGDWPLYVFAAERGDIGYIPEVMAAYRVHDGGFWSSASRLQKDAAYVRFYRAMRSHLGPSYDRCIVPILAHWYIDLGLAREAQGDYTDAIACFVTAFRLRPFSRKILLGRGFWHVARLTAYSFLRGGITPAQAAGAVVRAVIDSHDGLFGKRPSQPAEQ